MLRLYVRFANRQRWQEIANGPFPVTAEQIAEARRRYAAEVAACFDPFAGVRMAPQSSARSILRDVAPALSEFDAVGVGMVVVAPFWRAVAG